MRMLLGAVLAALAFALAAGCGDEEDAADDGGGPTTATDADAGPVSFRTTNAAPRGTLGPVPAPGGVRIIVRGAPGERFTGTYSTSCSGSTVGEVGVPAVSTKGVLEGVMPFDRDVTPGGSPPGNCSVEASIDPLPGKPKLTLVLEAP